MKCKVVIFEGLDKTGKSTLIANLNKKTNYKYWVLDRSFISSIVYSQMYERHDEEYWIDIMKMFINSFDVKVIYCHTDTSTILERMYINQEILDDTLMKFEKVHSLFINILTQYNINYLSLDTSASIDECIKQIEEFIK